jgi:serine/threonine-protein kinase
MGSVYRADDLRLKQPVALKLLRATGSVTIESDRLASEVRLAREVAHPNVCRVYDIGSEGGVEYLSMEFVDGETLTAHLRRGRLEPVAADDVARQICAGLAAAHDRGVLHRDIKPSNIMIGNDGRVRILDFGVAVMATATLESGRAGTPAYMAPEQVRGEPPSTRSDVYSLGLVLYELFTGDRLYNCFSIGERLRIADARVSDAALHDIDVTMQAVIRWCLARDPSDRPASAADVVAMLRGGPRARTVSEGRIPSPELILASHHHGALARTHGVVMAIAAIVGTMVLAPQVDHLTHLKGAVPMPPNALAQRARIIVASAGGPMPAESDSEFWFEPERSASVPARTQPRAVRFVYRQHSAGLRPTNLFRVVTQGDPPPAQAGMTQVILDPSGHLRTFETQAIQPPSGTLDRGVDWPWWFNAAGLNAGDFVPAEPGPSVRAPHDRQFAWIARNGERDAPLIRAALLDGRAAYFGVGDDAPIDDEVTGLLSTRRGPIAETFFWTLIIVSFVGASIIGLRNLKRRRGHLQAANRVAAFVAFGGIAAGLLRAHHVPDIVEETSFVLGLSGWCLTWAAFCWAAYLAFEPAIRRYAPQTLGASTRLLAGRFRDAVIGRDVLVGVFGGLVVVALAAARFHLAPARSADLILYPALESTLSWRRFAFVHLFGVTDAVETALAAALLVTLVRPVVRHVAIAACVVALLATPVTIGGLPISWVDMVLAVSVMLTSAVVFVRAGLLALATLYAVERLLVRVPITLDTGAWYFPASAITLGLVAALACYGAVTGFASTAPPSVASFHPPSPSKSRSS